MFKAAREVIHITFDEIAIKLKINFSTETTEARDKQYLHSAERKCQARFLYTAKISFEIKILSEKESEFVTSRYNKGFTKDYCLSRRNIVSYRRL